jgi:hypothetical protein
VSDSAEIRVVKSAEIKVVRGVAGCRISFAQPLGLQLYVFPVNALDYRAAEYGLDPDDSRTLLDIVLHEQHLQTDHDHPRFVYNTDEADARSYYLDQVADVKTRIRYEDPDGHLDDVYRLHPELRDRDLYDRHRAWCADYRSRVRN